MAFRLGNFYQIFSLTGFWRHSSLATMRLGFALTSYRSAQQPPRRMARETAGKITLPALAFVAGIFFAAVLAAQAQESVEPDILPSLTEPPAAPAESWPSAPAEPLPTLAESSAPAPAEALPSSAEPLPSSAEPLPSAEQAFPSSPEPLSPSTNYTTAQTSLVPSAAPLAPHGALDSKNVFPAADKQISTGAACGFHWALGLTVRGVWDDNIFLTHDDRVSDYYFAIEPFITVGIGDTAGRNRSYLSLSYMPSAILFVDHSDLDSFNQLIHLEGGYSSGRLTLRLFADAAFLESANLNSFIDTTGLWANIDATGPVRENIFYMGAIANYALTGKLSLQAELGSSIINYPNHTSYYEVSGGLYIYYNWLPKVTVGVGGTFGYDWVDDPTSDQTFEQINGRLNWEVTSKFDVYASAGVEFRQFDGNRGEYTSPVFEVGLVHHPFDGTTFTLAAGRRIYPSGFRDDQDFAATYIAARLQQRLFRRVYLGLGGGYENADYFVTDRDVSSSGNDDYWFIEPSLDVLITRWLSAGVYYLHREDVSDVDNFSWYDNQVGVRATLRF